MSENSHIRRASEAAKIKPLPPIDPVQRYGIPEVILYLRSSRYSVYADIKAGRLAIIKDRSRSYVLGSELIRRSAAPA